MGEEEATTMLGPAGATHVWQPCDHHLGRECGRRMAGDFENIVNGKVSASARRILLTKWAGRAYLELEKERKK
jgi:hypothetical protein